MPILKLIFRFSLGISSLLMSYIYSFSGSIKNPHIYNTCVIFIFLSPSVLAAAWSVMLVKLKQDELESIQESDLIKNASNTPQFIIAFAISSIKYYFAFLIKIIKNIPLGFLITILQKLKIFPILVFTYVYKQFKTIITENLMKNLNPFLKQEAYLKK